MLTEENSKLREMANWPKSVGEVFAIVYAGDRFSWCSALIAPRIDICQVGRTAG